MYLLLLLLTSNVCAYDKFEFDTIAIWENKPTVVLCHDSLVDEENLDSALNFWNNLGFKSSEKIEKKYCGDKLLVQNEIRITSSRDLDTVRYYGLTDREYYTINKTTAGMRSASIKLDAKYANNIELLIHEIGHALGIEHSKEDHSHIMHPELMNNNTRMH